MLNSKIIGERLRKLRKEHGLSQVSFAQEIGISPSAVAMYEQGERIPRDETKIVIAKFYNVSIESIFFTQ